MLQLNRRGAGSAEPSPDTITTAVRFAPRRFRYAQFKRALDWAEQEQLIAIGEIGELTYIWLTRPDPQDTEEE